MRFLWGLFIVSALVLAVSLAMHAILELSGPQLDDRLPVDPLAPPTAGPGQPATGALAAPAGPASVSLTVPVGHGASVPTNAGRSIAAAVVTSPANATGMPTRSPSRSAPRPSPSAPLDQSESAAPAPVPAPAPAPAEAHRATPGKRLSFALWSHYLTPARGNWAAVRSLLAWLEDTAEPPEFSFSKCEVPPSPLANECVLQRTLLFGRYFLRTLLFAGHGAGVPRSNALSPSTPFYNALQHSQRPSTTLNNT